MTALGASGRCGSARPILLCADAAGMCSTQQHHRQQQQPPRGFTCRSEHEVGTSQPFANLAHTSPRFVGERATTQRALLFGRRVQIVRCSPRTSTCAPRASKWCRRNRRGASTTPRSTPCRPRKASRCCTRHVSLRRRIALLGRWSQPSQPHISPPRISAQIAFQGAHQVLQLLVHQGVHFDTRKVLTIDAHSVAS